MGGPSMAHSGFAYGYPPPEQTGPFGSPGFDSRFHPIPPRSAHPRRPTAVPSDPHAFYVAENSHPHPLGPMPHEARWVANMKKRFNSLDTDKDGFVGDRDVAALAHKLSGSEGPAQESRTYHALNGILGLGTGSLRTGGPSVVPFHTFLHGMRELFFLPDGPVRLVTYAKRLFTIIDKDKNGMLELSEFQEFHERLNTDVDPQIVTTIFNDADTNKDG